MPTPSTTRAWATNARALGSCWRSAAAQSATRSASGWVRPDVALPVARWCWSKSWEGRRARDILWRRSRSATTPGPSTPSRRRRRAPWSPSLPEPYCTAAFDITPLVPGGRPAIRSWSGVVGQVKVPSPVGPTAAAVVVIMATAASTVLTSLGALRQPIRCRRTAAQSGCTSSSTRSVSIAESLFDRPHGFRDVASRIEHLGGNDQLTAPIAFTDRP